MMLERTGRAVGPTADVSHVDSFLVESPHDELRQFVVAQGPRIGAAASHARSRHEGRGRQPTALPLAATDGSLGIFRGIRIDVQQIIDRRVADSHNVKALVHDAFSVTSTTTTSSTTP